MRWLEQNPTNCSASMTLQVIGEKWTLLLLREAYFGVRRFKDFQRHLGIPRPVLSQRLAKLVDEGLLRRVEYQEPGDRPRHEYRLTDAGRDLFPTIVALMAWGDRYRAGADGPAITLHHRDCGAPLRLELRCEAGHDVESVRQVGAQPGAGARALA